MDAERVIDQHEPITAPSLDRLMHDLVRMIGAAVPRAVSGDPVSVPATTLEWGRALLPDHFAKAPSAMHEWLGAQLDLLRSERGSRVNVVGPRGSAKSTIATLCYVLRVAVEGWEPYIWIVSDTIPQAQLHLENVKSELTGNRLLAKAYPQSTGTGPTWRTDLIELPNGPVIEALSTGQRLRGRRKTYHRPSLIVADDLQNDGHMVSAGQREMSQRWFHGSLLPAGDKRTNVVNLATALHREALAMELLTAPGWTSRRFSAIETWPTNTQLWNEWESIYADSENVNARRDARAFYERHQAAMHAGAVVLWPAEEDLYTLMRMRVESGRTAFAREKQGSPVDPQVCEFPVEYFDDHVWFHAWPENLLVRAIALDPSKGGDARRGDYSAYAMIGVDRSGVIYVEADMGRRPTPQMVADGVALCMRFRPDAFGVEANQFQELLCGEFASEFARHGMGHIVPAAIHNNGNKLVRIRRLGPYLSQHRFRFLARNAATKLLVDQLRDFPNGAHDDGPDALEMAIRLAGDICAGRVADDGLGNRLLVG